LTTVNLVPGGTPVLLASGRPQALGDGPQLGRSGIVGPPTVVLGFGVDLGCDADPEDAAADGVAEADGVADPEDFVVGLSELDGWVADPYVPLDATALGFPLPPRIPYPPATPTAITTTNTAPSTIQRRRRRPDDAAAPICAFLPIPTGRGGAVGRLQTRVDKFGFAPSLSDRVPCGRFAGIWCPVPPQ